MVTPFVNSGVNVNVTPEYIMRLCGDVAHLETDQFWIKRGETETDAKELASNFSTLITALLNERITMLPIGAIIPAIVLDDSDYLECNGQIIDEVQYPLLWDMYAPYFIETSVKTPDLTGRVIVGAGDFNDGFDAQTFSVMGKGGRLKHQLTESEMPSHTHTPSPSTQFLTNGTQAGLVAGTGVGSRTITGATGGNQKHNNTQPYLVMRYWIKGR